MWLIAWLIAMPIAMVVSIAKKTSEANDELEEFGDGASRGTHRTGQKCHHTRATLLADGLSRETSIST